MRIVIGQVEVDLKNGGRISYDSHTDTLSIDPVQQIKRQEQPTRKPIQPKQLMIEYQEENRGPQQALTKTVLTQRIMALVKSSPEPTGTVWITRSCLGTGADPKHLRYLKLLLGELVASGHLIETVENNRKRYIAP